jgi:hypothetical protein
MKKTNGGIIGENFTSTLGSVTGKFNLFSQYNARLDNIWPFPKTVTTSESTTTLNETTNKTCTVTVSTTDYSAQVFSYKIVGVSGTVNADDFVDGLTGTFSTTGTLDSGTGTFDITIATDGVDETPDTETFTYEIYQGSSASGTVLATGSTITVSDTSTVPVLQADWYVSAYGATIGSLDVYLLNSDGTLADSTAVYSRSAGDEGNADWFSATASQVTLTSGNTYYLVFYYVSGTNFTGDLAVDRITIQGTTYDFGFSAQNWTQDGTGAGNFSTNLPTAFSNKTGVTTTATNGNWVRRSGSTGSSGTGPSSGFGGSGYYIYAETSGSGAGFSGQNFFLFSPSFTA